jgi:hypothetical protein
VQWVCAKSHGPYFSKKQIPTITLNRSRHKLFRKWTDVKTWSNPLWLEELKGKFRGESVNISGQKLRRVLKDIFRTCLEAEGQLFRDSAVKYGSWTAESGKGAGRRQIVGRCKLLCDQAPPTYVVLRAKINDTPKVGKIWKGAGGRCWLITPNFGLIRFTWWCLSRGRKRRRLQALDSWQKAVLQVSVTTVRN